MLILKENEICPFVNICPYNEGLCHGAVANRGHVFTCEYIVDGKFLEGQANRLSGDVTGKMQVIME